MKTSLVFFVAVCAALSLRAERQPIERYQSIIDRQMFGPLPPDFDPTKSPSEVQKTSSKSEQDLAKEQEKLKSAVQFSVINVADDGVPQVGFTDNSDPKTPRNYFLRVGESRDGWTVMEANADTASMTIARDDINVKLSLGGNSAQDETATSRAGHPSSADLRNFGPSVSSASTLRARMLQRRAEKDAAERARLADEAADRERRAADEAERNAQREEERAEYRQQLQEMRDELNLVREARLQAESEKKEDQQDAQDDAE